MLRELYTRNVTIAHLLARLEARQLYRACYVLTVEIGEKRRQDIINRFHHDVEAREAAEMSIARVSGIQPQEVIIYCPSFGMSLSEAEVPVRLDRGPIRPLSAGNNDEIRILREKHKALWKFFVFIDRGVWDKHEAVRDAASAYIGIT
jgi:hypothetical protein